MIQKLYKNGNSIVITIPRQYLKEAGWRVGDKIRLDYYPITKIFSMDKAGRKVKKSEHIDPDFFRAYEHVLKQYGPALKELAKR